MGLGGADRIRGLTDRLLHRGPDGGDTWSSTGGQVSLGHRRLAVIDPRAVSAQPMHSCCGRFTIVFNGEIYNYRALRERLSGHPFRTSSDTEVLVETIARLGIDETLPLLNGMYAFAVYDEHRNTMHLVCDRLGEKPVYYGQVASQIVFASELKAIEAHPQFHGKIDRDSLALFLRYNYIPAPFTIYQDVRKLEPAQHLTFRLDRGVATLQKSDTYWSLRKVVEDGLTSRAPGTEAQLLDDLEARLRETVASRMISDVPLGAFLSGGYDSTLVVAMMKASSDRPIQTFSIGQQDEQYNEAVHAKAVADHLGTEHSEWIVSAEDALDVIPTLESMYCEPFADASQIPTYLVSKMARRRVTVALSGDGGDELFGGYNRHFKAAGLWSRMQKFPTWTRAVLAKGLRSLTAQQWNKVYGKLEFLLGKRNAFALPGTKLHKLSGILDARSQLDLYRRLTSTHQDPTTLLVSGTEPLDRVTNEKDHPKGIQFEELMMYLDSITYLPGDILTKVDRASMATSLEARVPLLDHRLVEYAWRLPLSMKVRDGEGKWALKQIVHRHVPREIMQRPKMGFSVPLDQWLRGPLRTWAEDLLAPDRIESDGFFKSAPIQHLLQQHLSGHQQNEHKLWSILMFQSWQMARS